MSRWILSLQTFSKALGGSWDPAKPKLRLCNRAGYLELTGNESLWSLAHFLGELFLLKSLMSIVVLYILFLLTQKTMKVRCFLPAIPSFSPGIGASVIVMDEMGLSI